MGKTLKRSAGDSVASIPKRGKVKESVCFVSPYPIRTNACHFTVNHIL